MLGGLTCAAMAPVNGVVQEKYGKMHYLKLFASWSRSQTLLQRVDWGSNLIPCCGQVLSVLRLIDS